MLHRSLTKSRIAALLVAMALGVAFAAPADDLKEAQKLYNGGKLQPALEKVDAFLKVQPKDQKGGPPKAAPKGGPGGPPPR